MRGEESASHPPNSEPIDCSAPEIAPHSSGSARLLCSAIIAGQQIAAGRALIGWCSSSYLHTPPASKGSLHLGTPLHAPPTSKGAHAYCCKDLNL